MLKEAVVPLKRRRCSLFEVFVRLCRPQACINAYIDMRIGIRLMRNVLDEKGFGRGIEKSDAMSMPVQSEKSAAMSMPVQSEKSAAICIPCARQADGGIGVLHMSIRMPARSFRCP